MLAADALFAPIAAAFVNTWRIKDPPPSRKAPAIEDSADDYALVESMFERLAPGLPFAARMRIGKKCDFEFTVLDRRDASACVDVNGKAYRFVERCVADCFPNAGVMPYPMMGGTDCRHYAAVTENGIRCCPIRMDKQQAGSCHAIDENISITALAQAVKFYKYLLKRWK